MTATDSPLIILDDEKSPLVNVKALSRQNLLVICIIALTGGFGTYISFRHFKLALILFPACLACGLLGLHCGKSRVQVATIRAHPSSSRRCDLHYRSEWNLHRHCGKVYQCVALPSSRKGQ